MINTRRTSLSLSLETYDHIAEVQDRIASTLNTRLSMARVICAAVRQYRDRIVGATEADG